MHRYVIVFQAERIEKSLNNYTFHLHLPFIVKEKSPWDSRNIDAGCIISFHLDSHSAIRRLSMHEEMKPSLFLILVSLPTI